jgi:hypothetical protein
MNKSMKKDSSKTLKDVICSTTSSVWHANTFTCVLTGRAVLGFWLPGPDEPDSWTNRSLPRDGDSDI